MWNPLHCAAVSLFFIRCNAIKALHMKMMTRYLSLFALCAVAQVLPAAEVTATGVGAKTCADYMQAVRLKSDTAINGYISWAQGFITGYNWSNAQGQNVAVDVGGLGYWLTNRCGGHGDLPFYQAVQELIAQQAR